MRKSKSSSVRIDFPSHQFRRISNPQRNRSNLFCLRISNPQERLRRIEAPACFGGFAIRRQLPISDLQSAASYLFRICNPPPVTYFGFAIRRQLPISDLQSASSNGARTKKTISDKKTQKRTSFGGFAIRRQLPISDLQSAKRTGERIK